MDTARKPNFSAFFLIITFVLVSLGLLVILYFNSRPTSKSPSYQVKTHKTAAVEISSVGKFVPEETMVTKGTQVTWTNNDTKLHRVISDPHPTHTLLKDLDSGILEKGQSYSFTFEKSGTFTYHDELNPLTIKGTVKVQ